MELIRLNLIPTGPMPTCHASQYDKKREIGLVLFNGTRPLLLTDETLELDVRKSDSHIVTIDVPTPEGTNLAVFETTEQMCAVAGSNECELRIKKAGTDIGSLNFIMEIERSPMENGLQSDSEIRNLETQIAEAATPVVEEIAPPIIRDFLADDYYNKEAIDELIQTIAANFAGEYNEEDTYYNGAFVIYENALYRCIAEETSGEFDPEAWYQTNITAEMKEDLNELEGVLRALISDKMDKTNPTGSGSFSFNRRAGSTIGQNSVAFAENSVASGNNSFTAGYGHVATNYGAFAEGSGNEARGNCSHAEGRGTKSTNNNTHSEGGYTTASGGTSHAEGWETTASGVCSHAEGDTTIASGSNAHAEGGHTTASGNSSHSEGYNTTASGYVSHAEGYATEASATESHAEGFSSTASGQGAHAEGSFTLASGTYSHAEGEGTEANHKNQHVSGSYNIPDDSEAESHQRGNYVEIVGNGTGSYDRSNARTLDWQGNEKIAGNLTFNGSTSLTAEINRLDDRIDDLPKPMVYKGTLGTGGTITSLPPATASKEGYTYKVITEGTYAGQAAKIGDTFTCGKPEGSALFTWVLFSQGDTDTDTWRNIKVNGTEEIGSGISTGAVDLVDSDNIEWEYDPNGNKLKPKTKNIYTEAEVNELIEETVYDILPSDTESGAIANFETDLALPLKSAIFNVDAIQDLHGQSGAYPAGGGINQWDGEWEIGAISDATGLDYDRSDTWRTKGYIPILPNTSYYISSPTGVTGNTVRLRFYDSDKTYIGYAVASGNGAVNRSFVSPANAAFVRFNPPAENCPNHDISLNYPATDTAYHPYANICPISGRSEAEVTNCEKNLFNDTEWFENNGFTQNADGSWYRATNMLNVTIWENKSGYSGQIYVHWIYKYDSAELSPGLRYRILYTDGTGETVWTSQVNTFTEKNFTSASGKTVDKIVTNYGTQTNGTTLKDFCITLAATAYEAYNGETEIIQLGDTYYGGRLLLDKDGHRRFEVLYGAGDLAQDYSWQQHQNGFWYATKKAEMARCDSTVVPDIKAERYQPKTAQYIYSHGSEYGLFGVNGGLIYITDAETPSGKYVYPLATPYTIDLPDGEPITTAIGTNNIYADSGDTAVEFKESINQKIASLQALILST